MRIFLASVVVGFVILCGWLVVDAVGTSISQIGYPAGQSDTFTQQSADNAPETADSNLSQAPQIKALDLPNLEAAGGSARTITLGSIDPNSGFMFQLELTSKGASIARVTFSSFDDRDYKNPQPLVILSPIKSDNGSEILSMANGEFVLIEQGLMWRLNQLHWKSYDVEKANDGSQTTRFEATIENKETNEPVIELTKTYTVIPGSYQLNCDLSVENLSSADQQVRFNLTGPAGIGREGVRGDMRKVVGGFLMPDGQVLSSRKNIPNSFFRRELGLKDATSRYNKAQSQQEKQEAEKHLRISHKQAGASFLWVAATNKYFAAILRPVPDKAETSCSWVTDKTGWFYNPDGDDKADSGDETIAVKLKIGSKDEPLIISPNTTRQYKFQLYIGPKDKMLFDKNELYRNLGFIQTIDFMTCCCPASIIQPLAFGILFLLKWMHGFIPNYGVVIIILVFLMRLLIHPVTKRSQVSMHKFQKVLSDPEVQQIRKKYAKNQVEMNRRILAFQKERGISPMTPVMGMLPMMLQMPIWIALWSAVNASIDLRGAAFLPFWITDLSVPDALIRFATVTIPLLGWKIESINLLPIMMGVAFFLQQKLMPSQASAAANPQMAQQQKIMMIMFPLMFPLILYKTASGVNLYIMSSTFAGVFEQYVIRKHIREKEDSDSKRLVAATSKTGAKRKKKKPKPFYRY